MIVKRFTAVADVVALTVSKCTLAVLWLHSWSTRMMMWKTAALKMIYSL